MRSSWNKGLPKELQPFFNKKHTEKYKQLMSNLHKGKVISQKTKQKQSDTMKRLFLENKIVISDEARKKMGHYKGQKFTHEHKEKIRIANIGRKHTAESKRKQGNSMKMLYATGKTIGRKGQKNSPEHIRKMSEYMKQQFADGKWIPPRKKETPFDKKKYSRNYRQQHQYYFRKKCFEWRNSEKGKIYFDSIKNSRRLYNQTYDKKRKEVDLKYKIKRYLRTRVWVAFNLYSQTGKIMTAKSYGINYFEIVKHLIKTLPKDYQTGKYHIDHIIPLCRFDLTNSNEIQVAFSPANHQWLLAHENLKKGNKIIEVIR